MEGTRYDVGRGLYSSGWQGGYEATTSMEEETPSSSLWAAESHQGTKAVFAEGPTAIWKSRTNEHVSCPGCSLVRLPVNSSSAQPSIVQQIWCLCMPQNFALFKVLVIYRCLRWRMERGYLRNGDVIKQTTASVSRSLGRASLRPLYLLDSGDQSPS